MQIKNAHIKNLNVKTLQLVGDYRFNISSLTAWAGVTQVNSPTQVDGKYLQFTGSQSLITNNIEISTLTNNDYTYEFWVRTTGTNAGALLTKLGYSGYVVSAVEISGNSKLVPGYYAGSAVYLPVGTDITRDEWQHYTVTYNTGDGHLRTYFNGELVGNMTLGEELSPRDVNYNPMYFTLFASNGYGFGNSGQLTGDLGEFRLYTRALSDAEVAQNYGATRDRWGI
jgi:hypothetical protein